MPSDHLYVKELADLAIEVWGEGEWQDTSNKEEVHEANLLKLDISKAKKELQWQPKLNAAEAIRWTIEWYKKSVSERLDYSFSQIKTYQSL